MVGASQTTYRAGAQPGLFRRNIEPVLDNGAGNRPSYLVAP